MKPVHFDLTPEFSELVSGCKPFGYEEGDVPGVITDTGISEVPMQKPGGMDPMQAGGTQMKDSSIGSIEYPKPNFPDSLGKKNGWVDPFWNATQAPEDHGW